MARMAGRPPRHRSDSGTDPPLLPPHQGQGVRDRKGLPPPPATPGHPRVPKLGTTHPRPLTPGSAVGCVCPPPPRFGGRGVSQDTEGGEASPRSQAAALAGLQAPTGSMAARPEPVAGATAHLRQGRAAPLAQPRAAHRGLPAAPGGPPAQYGPVRPCGARPRDAPQ